MPLTFQYPFLLIAAGALLVPGRVRRLGLVGLVPLGLGIAATTVRLGGELGGLALRAAEQGAPLRFLQINSGLVLLGVGLIVVAVVMSLIRAGRGPAPTDPGRGPAPKGVRFGAPASCVAMLMVGGGAAPLVAAHLPLLSYIGWLPAVGAAIGIGAGAATLFIIGRGLRIGRAVAALDNLLLERNPPALLPSVSASFDIVWIAGFLASGVIMAITPSLRAFALATVVAGTVAHVLLRRLGGGSTVPVSALLSLSLIPVFQSFTAIAGELAPTMGGLAGEPLSVAAENRIVPWLGLAAWGFAGLWPLHGVVLPLAAPLAGVLLIRLGAYALPNGMEHWAPVFMPLALLGVWHAATSAREVPARRRRLVELLVGLSLFGIFAGGEGTTGAVWLLVAAALIPWSLLLPTGATSGSIGRLVGLPLIWGSLLVVTGGLAAQVTYTTLAAGGIAAAIWMYHTPE